MTQANLIYTLLGSVIVALCALAGVIYTAARKGKSDDAAAALAAKTKAEESSATVKVALVTDRDTWEQRLLARMVALEDALDKERAKRLEAEDVQIKSNRRIEELEEQVSKLKREKVLASKDYQDRAVEQDMTIHKLQDDLKALQDKYDVLQKEYEELLQVCNELRKQLQAERGQVADDVLTIARGIGVAEGPQPRTKGRDTNA